MMIYICGRKNWCTRPCYDECYYTTCFMRSKLFNDKNNNFWEMNPDPDWVNNLPEPLRANPLTLIRRSYDQLVQENISNKKEP